MRGADVTGGVLVHEDTSGLSYGLTPMYLRGGMNELSLGFACAWDRGDRFRTWSHTPFRLWEALERRTDVRLRDLPLDIPPVCDFLGRVASMRLLDGRRYSTWMMQPWYSRLAHRRLLHHDSGNVDLDAILCVGELGPTERPLYIYQDFCYGHGLKLIDRGLTPHGWDAVSRRTLERRAAMQNETFAHAAGVFTMSAWNARYMRDAALLPADRIHVVQAGVNVPVDPPSAERRARRTTRSERVIAFVGRDFLRKGGDLVLDAFRVLRERTSIPLRLVVAGPVTWPLPGAIPQGVEFIGNAPFESVRVLLHDADVLVMPSRFEAFGIIIAEALASGTPVIGRNDFAMPEMITHGVNGMLIDHDDAEELAAALQQVLSSDVMAEYCLADAARVGALYSWDRVARDMVSVIRQGR